MAKTNFQTVDEYIAAFPSDVQAVLQSIRQCIAAAALGAEETISYQLPAFKFHGWIFYFSAYADHYAISCPPPFSVFTVFSKRLSGYEVTKTAVKFPKTRPVPLDLIGEMAAYRANENVERMRSKKAKR
jgi:uncharacterized protein YdhG (YjbR/CyaY superfamily)